METQAGFPTGDSFSAFSALHLLRNYNQLFLPGGQTIYRPCVPRNPLHLNYNHDRYLRLLSPNVGKTMCNNLVQVYHSYPCAASVGDLPQENFPLSSTLSFPPLSSPLHPYPHYPLPSVSEVKSRSPLLSAAAICRRRPRGEKKPIPDDQKDDRYYERRKRNNQAAKKSRDARKLREDQIALRATLLEHENAILRAQLLTLREETESLRQVVLSQKKPFLGVTLRKEVKERVLDKKWETNLEVENC